MPAARIATVHYLNARPLVRGFTHGELAKTVDLRQASPARCAEWLESGNVDVALIPTIEYLRIPALTVLPGMAIASRREARSVLLISKVAAPEIRCVALDASSRTSAALVRILLSRRSRHPVAYREMEPDLRRMLESCDAALLIGDAALKAQPAGLKVYDLAAEWYAMTGLPFVFAFWAVRPGFDPRESLPGFLASKRQGLLELGAIAREASTELDLAPTGLEDYLRHNISYDLEAAGLRALWQFYRLAREASLVESAREVRLHGVDPGPAAALALGLAP